MCTSVSFSILTIRTESTYETLVSHLSVRWGVIQHKSWGIDKVVINLIF